MKGKNKLILTLLTGLALIVSSVVFAFMSNNEKINYASAAVKDGYTAELEGNVIFSTELVYFAEGDVSKRKEELKNYSSIETNNGREYYTHYGLNNGNGLDYSHKYIIKNNQFVKVDDEVKRSATKPDGSIMNVKQGILVTLGGYYYTDDKDIVEAKIGTNTQKWDAGNGKLDNADGEVGANMSFVSAQATLNGQEITLPNSRGYKSGSFQDFTWFIVPDKTTEGHYEFEFMYMIDGKSHRYDFEFYLLLESEYTNPVEVVTGGHKISYSAKPTITNATDVDGVFQFFSGTTLDYPLLTFDYSRYDLNYTYTSGDVVTTVDFDYDETNQLITLTETIYSDSESKKYQVADMAGGNTIISLMFVGHGKYIFHFDYIYKYQGEKITIPQEQVKFDDIELDIYGYQLKYSKAGFASADMTYLEIYRNGTMFILVDGFIDANMEKTGDNIGVNYKLITNETTVRTGTIAESNCKTAGIIDSKINQNVDKDIDKMIEGHKDVVNAPGYDEATAEKTDLQKFLDDITYNKTDRGLWLTINDEYYLQTDGATKIQESYYYYSESRITDKTVTCKDTDDKNPLNFEKSTTFTQAGYYLVQVKYDIDPTSGKKLGMQYFAFQITSTTPVLYLYKTKAESFDKVVEVGADKNIDNFYAREFTNQNVYAYWNETGIFESTVVGKLYRSNSGYVAESVLKSVASGSNHSNVSKIDYQKKTLLTDSGSYLLVLEVERAATKTYTYFTIDKDAISGLQVYEVYVGSIDNKAVYSIKQDASLQYVTHTSKMLIDTSFTLDWANKASGAAIYAKYNFTPFIKTSSVTDKSPIEDVVGSKVYQYILNDYVADETSVGIDIYKPASLSSALDVNNVLSDQGIYQFDLEDQAGNKLTYIIIVDKTEAAIQATYGDKKSPYVSGQMVADYVELQWGTHKAIDLSAAKSKNETIRKIFDGETIDNYYKDGGNNSFNSLFKEMSGKSLMIVENKRAEIKMRPFSANDIYYLITNSGSQQLRHPSGATTTGWSGTDGERLFTNVTNRGVKINIDRIIDETTGEVINEVLRRYTVEVFGANNVTANTGSGISVSITPDKAQGEVYSSSQEGDYTNNVLAQGETTKYFGKDYVDKNAKNRDIKIETYYKGQASNDGVFVFEWLQPSEQDDKFRVTEVKYNFYQLMTQDELNALYGKNEYPYYYPYKYIRTEYILETVGEDETISLYDKTTRVIKDDKGNIIQNKNINRSEPINLSYEDYYDTDGNLVSKKVTQTGLYIITRTIAIGDPGQEKTSELSYAFFVDRNMIVGYSLTDINKKIVGQFIHTAMPNSVSFDEVKYDNFTKQGLKEFSNTYIERNGDESVIKYKVYLETNKLPTQLQVPSGKYVSGQYETGTKEIRKVEKTSNINLKLKLSVYFLDSYKILPDAYKGQFIRLMNNVESNKDGYIKLNFANIDNPGIITLFKNARVHNEDDKLSLPGTYIFVINDTVSRKVNDKFETYDCNEFIFGIKLTNQSPAMDVYAYAQSGGITGDKTYSDGLELYTNQEFVDFEIPDEIKTAYEAQLDIGSVEVWRSSNVGGKALWLRLRRNGDSFTVDTSGIIQNDDRIVYDASKKIHTIKLDTGLTVVDNEIVDYKEYIYEINIEYILLNTASKYYSYKYASDTDGDNTTPDALIQTSFYHSTYRVVIDRSPNSFNLDELMKEQGEYFENYQNWIAEQNGLEDVQDVNQNFAYRNKVGVGDYYALANKMYYDVALDSNKLSNKSMFALSVGVDSTFSVNGLSGIYYRQLSLESSTMAKTRMGLLPISDVYNQATDYFQFNEDMSSYRFYNVENVNEDFITKDGAVCYRAIMGDNGKLDKYDNNWGGIYEIIEKDRAGNYTQYIIYFEQNGEKDYPTVKVSAGQVIGIDDTYAELEFSVNIQDKNKVDRETFIGITSVDNVANLANNLKDIDGVTPLTDRYHPYYGNINIYDNSSRKIKTIYTNSLSNQGLAGVENEIYNTIKEQGNYIVEYVDVYGQKSRIGIDNYTSDKHELNMLGFDVKKMGPVEDPTYYITVSELNSRIDSKTYWFLTEITLEYDGGAHVIKFTAIAPTNGKTTLTYSEDGSNVTQQHVVRSSYPNEEDRLYLAKDKQYTVTLKDVGGKSYVVPLSTTEGYYSYRTHLPDNIYEKDGIVYTANQVGISYNKDFYSHRIEIYVNNSATPEQDEQAVKCYSIDTIGDYIYLTLKPDVVTIPANHFGSLRRFVVVLTFGGKDDKSFEIFIDTRTTLFTIESINKVDKIDLVKSTLLNDKDENGVYRDYSNIMEFIDSKYYTNLIVETVNVSWTRLTSDYFTYSYDFVEFVNADEYKDLTKGTSNTNFMLSPKDKTTGKYVLRVTINNKNGGWIATRVFGIYMSTTITGLYEVKDKDTSTVQDYKAITNLDEIEVAMSFNEAMSKALGYGENPSDVSHMKDVFTSFGRKTAIPMYISNQELVLHSNMDNGVHAEPYTVESSYTKISFYRIWRANYQTFAVIMQVKPVLNGENILQNLSVITGPDSSKNHTLFSDETSVTVHDPDAQYYKLKFDSYNKHMRNTNPLEKHNRIIIDVYYNQDDNSNNEPVSTIKGNVSESMTLVEFKNGGIYRLVVRDVAGNVQTFSAGGNSVSSITVVIMKDVLYTINGNAPIPYAYYNSQVALQIKNDNPNGGKNYNKITLTSILNSRQYTGYEHTSGSTTYVFKEYGTYLIKISAELIEKDKDGKPINVYSQIVFTILNPNEARKSIDFTSIYGYDIVSVFSVTKTAEKDVTDKFIKLLSDKANMGDIEVYNKLITYDRVVEEFGSSTQGKMKFKVLYRASNDDLLPPREVEFAFTLNNETASITSSIKAGDKTTDSVKLKFNAANIYDLVGDCNLVVNGEVLFKIDEFSQNRVYELEIKDVGKYYVQLKGDSGNVIHSFNFTIKEPLNTVAIILIVVVVVIVVALIGTFIWLRTRMKVR